MCDMEECHLHAARGPDKDSIGLITATQGIYPVNDMGEVMEEGALGRDSGHSPQC